MEIQYNNLYTHFVFTTQDRIPVISETHRERIEKYVTGIVNNHKCKMYSIYANPEHMHFLVSKRDIDKVCKYIKNQPVHHKKQTFSEEYDRFLKFYQQTIRKIRE